MAEMEMGGEPPSPTGDVRQYPCPQCGGKLEFRPEKQQLECTHCGHLEAIVATDTRVIEHDFERALKEGVGQGYGVSRKSLRCENCGAVTSYDDSATTVRCAFCDSSRVVEEALPENIVRPETMIPFQIERTQALEAFRVWLSSRWFRPNNLSKSWQMGDIRGVYLPFWTYDCETDSTWTADAGYYYYTTETYTEVENGKTVTRTRQVRHVRWVPAWGQLHAVFDDELVCASKGLSSDMVRELYPYRLDALVAYNPQYLSGWGAERYQIDLRDGWGLAQKSIDAQLYDRCGGMVPGDTHRNLHVSTRYEDIAFKHVLLPLWMASYQYRGRPFRFLVNGQTGEVSGEAPYSWVKIALVILAAAILVAVYMYYQQQ